jgi:hypothetical protein
VRLVAVAPTRDRSGLGAALDRSATRFAVFRRRRVLLALVGLFGVSAAIRMLLATEVVGPWVFMDELGYHRLAHSLADSGSLALFGKEGLSYSPLYSVVLAPVYAFEPSAPGAYDWAKVVNALLMSLALFPIYKIARFVLPPRPSLLVAGLSAAAPLMYYTAVVMSENLAYPLFLLTVWAMLVALRTPSLGRDAALLACVLAASAARIQLVVLYPIAVTAVALAAALERDARVGIGRRIAGALRQHPLLIGAGLAGVVVAAVAAVGGGGVLGFAGRYANVGIVDYPDPVRVLARALENLAGLDLALGAVPFAGALVAGHVFLRRRGRREAAVFASVAVSATVWLLLEVGYNSAAFEGGSDLRRLFERYLIYLIPLFLVGLVAVVRIPAGRVPARVYFAAAAVTALLPAAIPFGTVINTSIVADSFGLQMFGEKLGERVVPIEHAKLAAVFVAALFALLYVLARRRTAAVALLVVLVFVSMSGLVRARVIGVAQGSVQAGLPTHHDWVDRVVPDGGVVLVGAPGAPRIGLLETAFNNFAVTRVYYVCARAFGEEFGERQISIDEAGRLRDGSEPVQAAYAVVPAGFGLRGRVLARNEPGGLVLVATPSGELSVPPGGGSCGSST